MADGINPIVIGGGIQNGSPWTVGSLTYITNIDPPVVAASVAMQRVRSGPPIQTVITIGADIAPTAVEALQVAGGLIAGSKIPPLAGQPTVVEIGEGAQAIVGPTASGSIEAVVIGTAAGQFWSGAGTGSSGGLVVIGHNARVILNSLLAGTQPNNIVLIGTNARAWGKTNSPNVGSSGVAIGVSVQLGSGATGGAAFGVVIGNSAWIDSGAAGVALGSSSRLHSSVGGTHVAVAIGDQAQAYAPGQIVIGHNVNGVANTHVFSIGMGRNVVTRGPNTFTAGGQNTQISDVLFGAGDAVPGGSALLLRATNGQGTNDLAADFVVRAGLSTGNTHGGIGPVNFGGRIRFQTGTVVGVPGTALQAAGTRLEVLPSWGTGAPTPAESAGVNFENVLDAAAAQVGTLANAPAAGNPTFWLPVQINGVAFAIPAWPL